MKLMNSLALRHVMRNKKQAFPALLAITLAVAMLVAVFALCFSMYDAVAASAKAAGQDGSESNNFLMVLILAGVFLGTVISGAAVIVISNAFNIQAAERTKQFGILKSVGATEKQIKSTIIAESHFLSLVGIPAGILVGYLIAFIAVLVMKSNVDLTVELKLGFNLFAVIAVVIAAALGYVTVLLASLRVAGRVSKLSAIEAIRQTDDIKIDAKKLKTSKIIEKIFGFEGALAIKQLKRNKRKFRVTVISLVTSIILFLSAFSFGDLLLKTAQGAYANTGANIVSMADANSANFSAFDNYESYLRRGDCKNINVVYMYRDQPVDEHKNKNGDWYNILAMNDDDYNKYCDAAKIPRGSVILSVLPDQAAGKTIPYDVTVSGVSLTVTHTTNETTTFLKAESMISYPNIIIPRSKMTELAVPITANYFIEANDAGKFISYISGVDKSVSDGFTKAIYNFNTEESTRELQRMYTVLMFFVYTFIGMLALIGATSVLATINSNINLRKSEFATLRAVGMQSKKLYKMLNLESIFYGTQSLLIGLPIGALFSYLMYLLFYASSKMFIREPPKVPYQFPIWAFVSVIVAVFVINLASMFFAAGKIRRSNIVETIRELNC